MSSGALHLVVPYGATNSTVRTRGLEWVSRLDALERADGRRDPGVVTVHGPGFERGAVPPDATVLLLRNVGRLTRGRREERLLRSARLGVYDLDDGLPWDDGTLDGLGRWWKRPWPRSLVARRAARAAQRVIAGNQTIADWASDHCADVRIVPTCVEPSDYRRRASWEIDGGAPVIGWIGSPATQGYLLDIAPALRAVHDATGARVEVVGGEPNEFAGLERYVDVIPWSLNDSHRRIASWDVGLMPLRDGVYERAKCGYKLLQYAAAGVPAVGSPVGVNRTLLSSMKGLAPETTDEWADALREVVGATAHRRAGMARCGFDVAEQFSYSRWFDTWRDAVGVGTP